VHLFPSRLSYIGLTNSPAICYGLGHISDQLLILRQAWNITQVWALAEVPQIKHFFSHNLPMVCETDTYDSLGSYDSLDIL
jgi:hypothetical protein